MKIGLDQKSEFKRSFELHSQTLARAIMKADENFIHLHAMGENE
jgi:hypothetical protein